MFLTQRMTGVALLLAAAAAFWPFGTVGAVLAAVAAMSILALLDRQSAPRAGVLQAALDAPEVTGVGQTVDVTLRLHNPASGRLRGGVHLQAPPSAGRVPARHQFDAGPGEWVELVFTLSPAVRGFSTVGPVTVRTRGRLGLAGRQEVLALQRRLKVYPALPGRKQVGLRLNRAQFLKSGIRSSVQRGEGTDFDSVRPYHPDDDFRRINWRATARTNEPITNTYRQERNQRVLILVDAGRTMATSIGGSTRFEHAMDSCVALAELAGRMGDHVGMMAFGSQPLAVVPPKSGKVHARLILDQLFRLHPSLDASNYRRAFSALLSQFSRRALLVLLTELTEPAAMQSLFQALPVLVRRHLVIVASMTDPAVNELITASPIDSREVYLKAAAEGMLAGRNRAAFGLRSMGAVVLDTDPGELPGRLADEYLRLKAFGRL
ncbi:MAG TPA: DUF58 domain-containing protein [Actinomycetota bacterium]|nr:DUF58 domain-containing protein [Actinomycetota bacterium]